MPEIALILSFDLPKALSFLTCNTLSSSSSHSNHHLSKNIFNNFFERCFFVLFLDSTRKRRMDLMVSYWLSSGTVPLCCLLAKGNLFRFCLSSSTCPACWKIAFIQPVPKKDHCQIYNYRPFYPHILSLLKILKLYLTKKKKKAFSIQ